MSKDDPGTNKQQKDQRLEAWSVAQRMNADADTGVKLYREVETVNALTNRAKTIKPDEPGYLDCKPDFARSVFNALDSNAKKHIGLVTKDGVELLVDKDPLARAYSSDKEQAPKAQEPPIHGRHESPTSRMMSDGLSHVDTTGDANTRTIRAVSNAAVETPAGEPYLNGQPKTTTISWDDWIRDPNGKRETAPANQDLIDRIKKAQGEHKPTASEPKTDKPKVERHDATLRPTLVRADSIHQSQGSFVSHITDAHGNKTDVILDEQRRPIEVKVLSSDERWTKSLAGWNHFVGGQFKGTASNVEVHGSQVTITE